MADIPEGDAAIQQDLDHLEEWPDRNVLKVSKDKCEVLQLDSCNARHQHVLAGEQLECSSMEKDLGVLLDPELNMSHQCAFAAQQVNCVLGCFRRIAANRSTHGNKNEGILLLSSALVRLVDC